MNLPLTPKLRAPNCLHLMVIRAVEIPFRCANVRVAHQGVNGSKVIPIIQEGRGESVPHDRGMNPLLDQCRNESGGA